MSQLNTTTNFAQHWLEDFFPGTRVVPKQSYFRQVPVNIFENDEAFTIEMVIPGRKKTDFVIKAEDQKLYVSAVEPSVQMKPVSQKVLQQEFSIADFSKTFNLPKHVEISAIEAVYDNGILSLTIPKTKVEKLVHQVSVS